MGDRNTYETIAEKPLAPEINNRSRLNGTTSAQTADNTQILSRLSQEVANLRKEISPNQHLRDQIRWLTGFLIASVVILGGGLIATNLNLRQEQAALHTTQAELEEQVEAIASTQASDEQLGRLEEQLQALNEQTRAISEQARTLSEQLPEVSLSQLNDLQRRLAAFEQGIQDDLSEEAIIGQFNQLNDLIQRLMSEPDADTSSSSNLISPRMIQEGTPASESAPEN